MVKYLHIYVSHSTVQLRIAKKNLTLNHNHSTGLEIIWYFFITDLFNYQRVCVELLFISVGWWFFVFIAIYRNFTSQCLLSHVYTLDDITWLHVCIEFEEDSLHSSMIECEPRVHGSVNIKLKSTIYLHLTFYFNERFDDEGKYLFTGSDDGNLFILHGQATKQFQAIGHTGKNKIVLNGDYILFLTATPATSVECPLSVHKVGRLHPRCTVPRL